MDELKRLTILNIKKYRKDLGYTQEALAEALGVSVENIRKIEGGKQFPSHKTLLKLINLFEVSPYQLFIDENDAPFDREAYIDTVYPIIIKDIKKNLKSVELPKKDKT